ncbi:ABC transporter substrate-binding protein [Halococcus hamelinensis]|uniref:Ferrichrome-binding protein n=1 Tax=Halococcus hamelinensis 100A6 TaxID=1132509 RepID=M0M5V4_9EURY|nr:ABC transporter substrate-binding protein [Halococcus hamelinensis]EMA40788.1 ferrichrome-binding protein [Halococcus hamelinensis 100A6]
MANDSTMDGRVSRRQWLRSGAVVVGGGLLAGCSGGSGSEGGNSTNGGSGAGTDAANGSGPNSGTGTSGTAESTQSSGTGGSYSVSMAPAGEVSFDGVPEDVMVYSLYAADAMVAYGAGDAVNSLGFSAEAGGNTLSAYYERLDGVSFDSSGLQQLNEGGSGGISVSKEVFYQLDSDLHLIDPALVVSFDGWSQSDVTEIGENVAPWFGNNYSRDHTQPPKPYRSDYQYYTLWEVAEKLSQVFQQHQRFQQLASIHDDLVDRIQSNLPPKNQRPTVAELLFMDGTFYPSKINSPGFGNAHIRPLKATDAFTASDIAYGTSYDFEQMLEVDPDVILHQYGIASYYDVGDIRTTLENDSVASNIAAVENDRVYPSGDPVQGPLMNLFQLEMTAKQLYPDQFGEWPDYSSGDPYPQIPKGEQLFDRTKVANVVTEGN